MRVLSRRLTALGLSLLLTITGTGTALAANCSDTDSHGNKAAVQPAPAYALTEDTADNGQEEPKPEPKRQYGGGYVPTESDRNVPVVVEDGNYEGMDIADQAYDEAYASVNLEDIEAQDMAESDISDEDAVADDPMNASSADKHLENIDKMPPVRDQGNYETCWAFSTLAAVEGDLIADGAYSNDIDLSELHLAYYTEHFNTSVQSDPLGGTKGDSVLYDPSFDGKNYLMTGGNTIYALKALMAWAGAVKEEREPYSTAQSTLSVPDSRGLSTGQYTSDVHVNGWYCYNMSSIGDRILIKDAIIKHGAVAASYFANRNYYDETNNTYYDPRDTATNHAVAIVGWNDTIPASSFKGSPAGPGAWLVRNSGGANGYEYDGYFWLSYYNKANITENVDGNAAYAVDATPASEDYDNNYTYDGQIGCDYGAGYAKSFTAVNIFTAKSNEVLEAVAFEAFSSKVDYTVDVYTDVHPIMNASTTDPNLNNAKLADTITGTTTAKGYYNLKLNRPVTLSKGQTFAVKVTISHDKANEDVYLGKENALAGIDGLKQTAASPSGKGFGYTNGWRSDENASFCIKAYTDNRRTNGLTSVSITGQSDGDVLKVGGDYVLKVQGNNNALISSVKWSSSNENVLSVKERTRYSSLLDVKNEGSAKVTATVYGIDGSGKPVSFTKSLNFTVKGAAVQNVTVSDSYGNNTGKSEKVKTVTLRAMITEGSTENNMKWTTSDSSVVSIAPSSDKMSCTITPKALGSAVITATASNGKSGSYNITIVKPASSVTIGWGSWRDEAGIDLNYSSSQGTRDYWKYDLDGYIDGEATDTDLKWSSDNHSIITIEDVFVKNGIPRCTIKVRPVAGKTTITARSPYSGAQGSFTFTTYKNPVTAVSIKDAAAGRVEKGKSITLTAEYSPKNADYGTELEWSVSDSGRLSLKENANGTCTVTGLNSGVAYVTATSIKTGESCDYKVTVWTPVDSIQVFDNDKKKSSTLNIGSTNYLTGYLNSDAEPGQDMTVTWTSSDESVATVKKTSNDSSYYSYATITAQNPGSAVITATTANGLKDTYKVTVTATAVSQVKLNRSSLVLNKGDSESLTATVYPAGAANKSVRWSSSDTSVAEVSDSGRITARSRGTADITVTTDDGGYKASCRVTVVNNDDIYVTDAAGETSGKKEVDSSVVLTVESRSAMSVNVSQWTITNSSVAEIVPSKDKQSCRVTPKASGTATIAVTTVYGETAEYELKVISPVTSVSLKIGESKDYAIQVNPGQSRQLTLTAELNEEATDTDLVWTSDNPEIVTIAQTYVNGRTPGCIVEAQPVAGKAVIRAISPYSGVSDTFTVTIYKEPVSGITISGLDPSGLEKGKSATLTAGFAPENADYGTQIEWSADNNECLKFKANPDGTCTVTGLDSGEAYIKAASKDINVYDTQRVLVWAPVTSIKIQDSNGAKGSTLRNGEETVLTSKLNDDASDSRNFGVTWKSSNPEVASIHITEQTGNTTHARLIAESPGNAVITATTSNGLTAKYTVEVLARVTGVQMDDTEITIDRGMSKLLKATVTPSEAADNTINWSSSDESVATVDPYGLVKAINPGAAWIKAQSNDGPYWAECQVTVEIPADSLTLDQTSLSIGTGDTVHLTAQFSPADATNKNLRWESSDRGVAVVEDGNVTAVGSGNATITARSETGLTASCEVSVVSKVTGVTLNESQLYLMVGDTDHLVAKVSPSDATEQGIVWTSGDSSVVTVNDTGEITAVAEGSTYITAETKDGGYKATCLVTVATLPEAEIEIGEIGTENTITYGNAIQPAVKISIKGTPAKGTAETKIVKLSTIGIQASIMKMY